jgi:hypothetical protein
MKSTSISSIFWSGKGPIWMGSITVLIFLTEVYRSIEYSVDAVNLEPVWWSRLAVI